MMPIRLEGSAFAIKSGVSGLGDMPVITRWPQRVAGFEVELDVSTSPAARSDRSLYPRQELLRACVLDVIIERGYLVRRQILKKPKNRFMLDESDMVSYWEWMKGRSEAQFDDVNLVRLELYVPIGVGYLVNALGIKYQET